MALTLPEGYLTAAGNQSTRWAVSPLAAGETERFRVVIKATDDRNRLPTAVPVTATLHTGVRILDQQTLYFGIVARQGGRPETVPTVVQTARGTALENEYEDVGVIIPAEAAPTTTTFTYTPLYDWQSQRHQAQTNGIPKTVAVDLGNVLAYKQWRLSVSLPDRDEAHLDEPIQVAVDAAPLLSQGVDPTDLRLWAYDPVATQWRLLPTSYDAVENQLHAWIYYFPADSVDSQARARSVRARLPCLR